MELAGEKPGVVGQFDGFHQGFVARPAADLHARRLDHADVVVVDLVAVAMTLDDRVPTVDLPRARARHQTRLLGAEAHGASVIECLGTAFHLALAIGPLGDQTDHRVRRAAVEFGAVGTGQSHHVAGELDHRHLHAQADAEIGNAVLAGVAHRADLALHAALAEAAGHQNAVTIGKPAELVLVVEDFGIDVAHHDPGAIVDTCVFERFVERLVGIQQIHVLANHGDHDLALGVALVVHHQIPLREIGSARSELEFLHHQAVESPLMEMARDRIDALGVHQRHHGALLDAGEQRDLAPRGIVDGDLGATDQHVGLQADGAQFLHRMLGGLGLGLARGGDIGHQRQMHEQRAIGAQLDLELADRFQKRLGFDVADGAADLHQRDVGALPACEDAPLDLVGDVGDDLDGAAQIIAAAFPAQDGLVDLAGGEIVLARHAGVEKPLVMAQIEIGLGAILGDEHLAVLKGTHGARIDIQVRIELEHGDLEAPRLQQGAQRCRGDAFAEGRNHPTSYENESRRHRRPVGQFEVEQEQFLVAAGTAAERRRTALEASRNAPLPQREGWSPEGWPLEGWPWQLVTKPGHDGARQRFAVRQTARRQVSGDWPRRQSRRLQRRAASCGEWPASSQRRTRPASATRVRLPQEFISTITTGLPEMVVFITRQRPASLR